MKHTVTFTCPDSQQLSTYGPNRDLAQLRLPAWPALISVSRAADRVAVDAVLCR